MNKNNIANQAKKIGALGILLLTLFLSNVFGQDVEIRPLAVNQTIEREMTGAQTHRYQFDLQAGEFFQVRVEQKGIDVALKLTDADGKTLAAMDSPNGKEGFETLSFAADKSGAFILEVSGFDDKAEKGIYIISRSASRNATETDKRRVAVEKLFIEGVTAYNIEGQSEISLKKLEEALQGWRELQDEYLLNVTAQQISQLKAAKPNAIFDEAFALFQQRTAESYKAALVKFQEASRLYAEIDEKGEKAGISLFASGSISNNLGEKSSALKFYQKALLFFQDNKYQNFEATTLNNIGRVYDDLGEKQKALEFFNRALPLYKAVGDKSGEATTLNNIGIAYSALGEEQKALEFYNLVLPLTRTVGDKHSEATTLNNIGRVYDDLGEKQKALEFFNRALPLYKAVGDKSGEATTLNNIGGVYSALGEKQKALEYCNQALPLYKQVGDKSGEATTLSNIGSIYDILDENQKAIESYNQSLVISRTIGNKSGEGKTLNNLGLLYYKLDENQKSTDFFKIALEIFKQIGDKSNQAISLFNLGVIYEKLGDSQIAKFYFQQAVALNVVVRNPTTVIDENKISEDKKSAKELKENSRAFEEIQKSRKIYLQTLEISKSEKSQSTEAKTLSELMFLEWTLDNPEMSILYGKQAINIFQKLRFEFQNEDLQTQNALFHSYELTYRKLADILIAEGRIAEAEQVLAMLKEEELFDYLRRDDKAASELRANITLSPTEKEAFQRYEEIADEITRIGKEFGKLEKESRKFPVGEFPRQVEMDKLDAQLADARKVFNKFLEGLDAQFRNKETKEQDARVAQVSGTKAFLDGLNQPRTVIISTIAGEDRLNLIVTTAKINRAHTVDIKAADLNELVSKFRDAVRNPSVDPRPLGKKLFNVLFPADLQKDLAGVDADTIVWSLDGTLRYAPVAALWDGEKYLAERYANAVITLASLDKIDKTPAQRGDWTALGVGVSKEFETFPALTAVPEELCRVVNDPKKKAECLKLTNGAGGVMNGVDLMDDEFTFQNFKLHLGRYKVVHIASHFALKAGNETNSYLLLGGGKTGDERKLTIANIREELDNKFVGTELLVLSACNTAMSSGENSSGAEIEGFGALAQLQGAKTVLASLWSVADTSTMELMSDFYGNLENDPTIGKAEALRMAQLKMIRGEYKTPEEITGNRSELVKIVGADSTQPAFKRDEKAPFAHPFYWSPFVLFGNWK